MPLRPTRAAPAWKTSATRTELVTTVRSGTSSSWCASAYVVVPPDSAIALPGATSSAAARAMSSLARQLQPRLGLETRLVGARLDHRHRAAVHLLHDALPGQRVEVAADRHVGDAELAGQLVDADAAAPPHLVEDQGAPLLREEVLVVAHAALRSLRRRLSDTSVRVTAARADILLVRRSADVPSSHGPVPSRHCPHARMPLGARLAAAHDRGDSVTAVHAPGAGSCACT